MSKPKFNPRLEEKFRFVHKQGQSRPRFQPDLDTLSESQRKMVLAARGPAIPEPDYSQRYRNYINSPEWAKKRAKVFKTRGRVCERCGTTRGIIQVHHKTYARLGREPLEDLEVMCLPCHDKHHGKRFAVQNERFTSSGDLESKWMHITKIQAIR